MTLYYNCFEKTISIKLYEITNEALDFWLKRFCPSIIKIQNSKKLKIDLTTEAEIYAHKLYVK